MISRVGDLRNLSPEALKEVTLALSLARPEVATKVHGHLRSAGYAGREIGSVPWNIARAYVMMEAISGTDRVQ